MLDQDNSFNGKIKTEDIFIDNNLFDNTYQNKNKKGLWKCPLIHEHRSSKNSTWPGRVDICRFTWRITLKSLKNT